MTQTTVNERLKFLITELNLSARAFSAAIGMPDSNTRNYLSKGTKLNSEYIESIALHFSHVNLNWLITGNGAPFLAEVEGASSTTSIDVKKNRGNVIGTNQGDLTQSIGSYPQDVWKISNPHGTIAAMEALIEQLKSQLADKERIIQLLEKGSRAT